jgi:hypothetical protein
VRNGPGYPKLKKELQELYKTLDTAIPKKVCPIQCKIKLDSAFHSPPYSSGRLW